MTLLRTLRHLRWEQIAGQLRHRSRARWGRPERFRRRSDPLDLQVGWSPVAPFLPPPRSSENRPDIGVFDFLGDLRAVGRPIDWDAPAAPKLWRYNLHYFDYLWSLARNDAAAIARDWVRRHRLERGREGWEPYPTSLRLQNWVAYFWGEARASRTWGDPTLRELQQSVALQADWLEANLETHLGANHLLENAAALALCGACFSGAAAERWLSRGAALLRRELADQVLGDGVHVERSPMYQIRVTTALLTLYGSGNSWVQSIVRPYLARLLDGLDWLCHPDDQIALLNDSAFGVYADPAAVREQAKGLGIEPPRREGPLDRCFALAEAGYYGARTAAGHYFVCDAGELGPDYQPGHGHADLLSFELSLHGSRVIRDAGVMSYEPGDMRRYCRATRAHNTVEINGADQSELWASFRVARRARPTACRFVPGDAGFELEASHDGYRRLPGRPVHNRRFEWLHEGTLSICDSIEARRVVRVASRFHFHPDCEVTPFGERGVRVSYPAGEFWMAFAGAGELAVETSWYCPTFGTRLVTPCLVLHATGRSLRLGSALSLHSADDANSLSQSLLLS